MTDSKITKPRIDWIDSLRGFAMVLVVYCHNFPIINDYIYSFHVPLFFFVSGIFHPNIAISRVKYEFKKRFITIMIPYYLWALLLFVFWYFIGKNFGNSKKLDLSIAENFIGVLVGQGGSRYMDWGIPLWFLPCIFSVFIIFSLIRLVSNTYLQYLFISLSVVIGFYSSIVWEWTFWSMDVALISTVFYGLGSYLKDWIRTTNPKNIVILLLGVIHVVIQQYNGKVDMYRSNYGINLFFFYSNALLACAFFVFLFRKLPKIKVLAYIGRNTIPFLALQIRTLTLLKGLLMLSFGFTIFHFGEAEKVGITFIQILILLPISFFINKYIPIMNGKIKKL